MKYALSLDDLVQNKDYINDFLDSKGMTAIYGGQSTMDGTNDNEDCSEQVLGGNYTEKIYPNYSESTYVNRHYVQY